MAIYFDNTTIKRGNSGIPIINGGGASNLQSKSVTFTANGTVTITSDDGYDGLSSVDVTVDVASSGITWYNSI